MKNSWKYILAIISLGILLATSATSLWQTKNLRQELALLKQELHLWRAQAPATLVNSPLANATIIHSPSLTGSASQEPKKGHGIDGRPRPEEKATPAIKDTIRQAYEYGPVHPKKTGQQHRPH